MSITEADDEVDKTKEYIRKKISVLKGIYVLWIRMYILITCYIADLKKWIIKLIIFSDPRPSKRVNQSLFRKDEAEELERHLEKINMLIDEGDRMEDECRRWLVSAKTILWINKKNFQQFILN